MSVPARFLKPWVVKEQGDGFVVVDQHGVDICGPSHCEDTKPDGLSRTNIYLGQRPAIWRRPSVSLSNRSGDGAVFRVAIVVGQGDIAHIR